MEMQNKFVLHGVKGLKGHLQSRFKITLKPVPSVGSKPRH
jgi:hypothetical protein